uniref:Uncharacterized protein n=1 Tax=Rhodosorus marinus TaxID=101924 RepID=A0A7S0BGC0_9RHOD
MPGGFAGRAQAQGPFLPESTVRFDNMRGFEQSQKQVKTIEQWPEASTAFSPSSSTTHRLFLSKEQHFFHHRLQVVREIRHLTDPKHPEPKTSCRRSVVVTLCRSNLSPKTIAHKAAEPTPNSRQQERVSLIEI